MKLFMRVLHFFVFLFLVLTFLSCGVGDSSAANEGETITPIEKVIKDTVEVVKVPEPLKITFQLLAVKDTLNWLQNLPDSLLQSILVVNRLDKKYLASMDSIVVPDSLSANLNLYCPFPEFADSLVELDKIIYVSRFAQAFAVYEKGNRVYWGPVSTGKEETQTPKGLYSTNWKSKVNISSVNSDWILNWSFNIDNGGGISFHEYALPGYPASHSCARMYADDAKWMYYWADQWIMGEPNQVLAFGTPVVIFDDYPYHEQKPWLRLGENKDALLISADKLYQETKAHYEVILDRQKTRNWVIKKREEEKAKLKEIT